MPYPLDLTGVATSNLIIDELHISTEQYINNHYYIFPQYVSFYKNSLIVKAHNGSSWVTLTPNVDYIFKAIHLNATRLSSHELYGFIELINPTVNQTVSLTYQTLGGSKQPDVNVFINKIIDDYKNTPIYILDVLTTDFDPIIQTPTPSFSQYSNTKSELEVVEKLHDISNSIADSFVHISNAFKQHAKHKITKSSSAVDYSSYVRTDGDQLNIPFSVTTITSNQNSIVNKSYVENAFSTINTAYNNLFNFYNNKLNKSNPISNNPLYLTVVNISNAKTALTKTYVENAFSSSVLTNITPPVGTVIQSAADNTPPGYLKCNGAAVSKTIYSDLYGVIGDNFSFIDIGGGTPWRSQWGFNPSTQNDITGWVSANNLTTGVSQAACLATKNYIYVLGGYDSVSASALNTIQRASFDANGDLTSSWSNAGTLPVGMNGMGYVAAKGRFYLIGGYDGSGLILNTYSAPINNDGTLGAFRAETSLPTVRGYHVCFAIKNKLYVVGGFISNFTNTVYQATINNDGTLSGWTTLPNFPISFFYGKPLLIKDKIYIFGANDGNGAKIYYAIYDSNGNIGPWTYVGNIPNNTHGSAIVCTDNYVFSIGGYDSDNSQYTNAAYCAPILPDGSIDTWTQISNGPAVADNAQTAIVGNKIYFIGGNNTIDGGLNTVYSANFTSGIIDYTPYYTNQQYIDPNNFYLPNYQPNYKSVEHYYIKTGV